MTTEKTSSEEKAKGPRKFSVTGMHCAACSMRVERAVKKTPGVTYHLLDAMNDDVLKAFLAQGFDAVVDFMTYRYADVLKKRLPMLLGSAGQYVLFSSYRVYAEGAKLATETSPRLSDVLPQDDPWRHRTGYAHGPRPRSRTAPTRGERSSFRGRSCRSRPTSCATRTRRR